jgi:nicotinamidase-related amidase
MDETHRMDVAAQLHRSLASVLVVDMQAKLLPAIVDAEARVSATIKLIEGAKVLGVPVHATEQYPAGLGATDPRVAACLSARPFEKMQFSAFTREVEQAVAHRGHIILAGIETHVCIQQTALELVRRGRKVWLCAECTGSRRELDREIAFERLRHAGVAVTTVESVLFELMHSASAPEFKQILKLVK